MKAFIALVKARTMEFVRDQGTFYWNLLFPVVLVVGFAFAFGSPSDALFKIGVLGPGDPGFSFLKTPQAQVITYTADDDRQAVIEKVRLQKLDALVDTTTHQVWLNDQGKNHAILTLVLDQSTGGAGYQREAVTGAPIRYVDQLVPGVIGMNIMFSCLFGVGYVLVRYRKNGVLKRMKATPVSALTFITAQGVSRFLIVLITSVVVYVGTNLFLNFRMEGAYLDLFLLTSLSILSMIALGLAFASRFKSEELAGGLLNLITFPMMIFSGVFFSLEGTPDILQMVSQGLPLTHYIQATRSIMLEGASLIDVWPHTLFLGVFTAACLGLAAWLFKWE